MTLTVPNFEQSKVLVVGDTMLDKYWHGPTSRISPEAPVPVVKISAEESRAGGAANVALNLAHLGCQTGLLGFIGEDQDGETLNKHLTAQAVRTHWMKTKKPTITKLRVMSRNQQLIRLDFEDLQPDAQDLDRLAQAFQQIVEDYQVIIFSDYAKGCLSQIQTLIQVARKAQKIILVDPKGTDFTRYQQATLLTPNLSEFETLVGPCPSEVDIDRKGKQLLDQLNIPHLLVTRGDQGMSLISAGQPSIHLGAHAKEVFDVTGAGDTVIATTGAVLASLSPRLFTQSVQHSPSTREIFVNAISLANFAASLVVSKLGTAWIHSAELRRIIAVYQAEDRGIFDLETLNSLATDAKLHGERIIFTNGCFDILHSGHVRYLQQAKSLGDRLIVAVNDDASIKRLKGSSRPINSLQQRMTVLNGLASVDWVISFSEDTPENLIKAIKPDCLVKGGDYQPEQIVGADWVLKHGGEVKSLDFQAGYSTTNTIKSIQKHSSIETAEEPNK